MTIGFAEATESVLDGNYSGPLGLGYEAELIQRAAKAQIAKYLPDITKNLQNLWNKRDKEFTDKVGIDYGPIILPAIDPQNIRSGVEVMSLIEAPLNAWPSILVYSRNSSAYATQPDQFDTISIPLVIEILLKEGPVNNEEEVHGPKGLKLMEILDSKMQRITDAVLLCIKKDTSLSGTIGEIEKPAKVTTSLPWSRKENKNATGNIFIFQGKQLDFTVQKTTI